MRTLFVLKFIFCSWLLLVVGTALSAQVVADVDPKPFIEVTGIAEKELVPDEIYIQILLRERQTKSNHNSTRGEVRSGFKGDRYRSG